MPAQERSNAVKAGAFVIATIAVAVSAILILAGVPEKLRPVHRYVVAFDLREGAAGLQLDSPVRIGGRDVGRVVGITFERENGNVAGVLVEIAVDEDITLYEGATAFLERPLLGAGGTLNFESLGDPGAPPLPEGGVIPGEPQVPQFMAQAGYGASQREQLQNILAGAEDLTIKIDQAVEDMRVVIADARERSGDWFERADRIFTTASDAMEEIRGGVDDGRALIASLQEGVDENRPRVDQTIANVEAASASAREAVDRFNEETLALADDLLRQGRAAAEEARETIVRVDREIAEQAPEIRKSIANARLASDQLRLTAGEVRRTPWRLLYRPSERELEFELLYDAARTYASAVSDLRAASESLEELRETDAAEPDRAARLAGQIETAFERYEAAERRFLDLLGERTP
jgi:ABC-type transporter Mla subunit MlaD